ncbi:MAG: amidase [Actinomycetota bacterium]|nr:amidase [Actinomycetota bacterium]
MDDGVRWAGAATQARLVAAGEISPEELRAVAVDAIEHVDPSVGAVVAPLFDRPGDGVPMLLKDAGQELAGTPHWVGVAALRDAGARSMTTTGLVSRFERAGFSILGKAACPALSAGATTEPPGFPPTRNPWDPTRSAGGSSGGPAAAVAAGMVAVAHGSDATGSLRCPAALCGVVTLVPTAGLIAGVPPAGQRTDVVWRDFVLARRVEDLAFVFTALLGTAPAPTTGRLRVGLLDHDPELGLDVHPACREAVAVTGRLLEALGHEVAPGWPAALDHLWARSFAAFGVISDATRPPVLRWVSERLGRPVGPDELDDDVFEAAARAEGRADEDVAAARSVIGSAVAPIERWWDDHDVLVTPTTFQPAWPLRGDPGFREMGTLLAPFSLTGQPALSLPLHRTDPAPGVPALSVGAQLVGRRGDDELLLRLAADLQAAADWTHLRPPVATPPRA